MRPHAATLAPTMLRVLTFVSFGSTESTTPRSSSVTRLKSPPERRAHERAQSRFHVAIVVV